MAIILKAKPSNSPASQEGDIVAITTDDDGNALTIKVQSTDMGGGQGAPGGAPGGQSQGVDGYDAVNTYDSDTEVSDTSLGDNRNR